MTYKKRFSRNIGIISAQQQDSLKNTHVLICGTGGMGGVCGENLVRMGIGQLTLIDPDIFEEANLNRQIGSSYKTISKYKVNVLKKMFLEINPDLKIRIYAEAVCEKNINHIVKNVDVIVNGMDQFLPSIILERLAHKKGIPIVDAWLTPFANVFVIKKNDPHWEQYLNLVTHKKEIKDITDEDLEENLNIELKYTLSFFDPFLYITEDLVKKIVTKQLPRPSFSIVVSLCGVLMANEVFKLRCGYQTTDYKGFFFNQYTNEIIKA